MIDTLQVGIIVGCLRGKDGAALMQLRTTEIFGNENGSWKLIHRQADMLDEHKP